MSTPGPLIFSPEQRRHVRVVFTRTVRIFNQQKLLGEFPARNLSLGGLFIGGKVQVAVGEDCRLELHESGQRSTLILTFHATIVRHTPEGVAVQFTRMEEDSFMFLQTMVLYSSDDPIGVAEHFLEDFTANSVSKM